MIASGSTTMTAVGGTYSYPISVALDGAGNLYVVDYVGLSVVKNNNGSLSTTAHTAITVKYSNIAIAMASQINFDNQGNLYIADSWNNRVLKVARVNGALDFATPSSTTLVGSGFTFPQGVTVDSNLNVFIADTGFPQSTGGLSCRLVEVSSAGVQSTLTVPTYSPFALAVDAGGGFYVAEADTSTDVTGTPAGSQGDARLLHVGPDLASVTVLASKPTGTGNPQVFGALGVDLKGNVWAPEFNNNQIVYLGQSSTTLAFGYSFFERGIFGPQTTQITNVGNATLDIYSFTPPQYFSQQGGSCFAGTLVAPGSSCTLSLYLTITGGLQGTFGSPFYINDNVNNAPSTSPHQDSFTVNGGSLL